MPLPQILALQVHFLHYKGALKNKVPRGRTKHQVHAAANTTAPDGCVLPTLHSNNIEIRQADNSRRGANGV